MTKEALVFLLKLLTVKDLNWYNTGRVNMPSFHNKKEEEEKKKKKLTLENERECLKGQAYSSNSSPQ